jgi:hypothetical protein
MQTEMTDIRGVATINSPFASESIIVSKDEYETKPVQITIQTSFSSSTIVELHKVKHKVAKP